MTSKRAVLLSGGIDSTALAAWVRPQIAFVVNYGQRCASAELRASSSVAKQLGFPLLEVTADCANIGSGDLVGRKLESELVPSPEWWPFRNQLLASLVGPLAVEHGVTELLFGTVKTDGVHADGRQGFFTALSGLMSFQEGSITVSAPAVDLTSVELVRAAGVGMELLGWTHSCHTGNAPCGICRGCAKHIGVLREIGAWP